MLFGVCAVWGKTARGYVMAIQFGAPGGSLNYGCIAPTICEAARCWGRTPERRMIHQCCRPIAVVHDMPLSIEIEQEDDGRWLAELPDLPGVLAYGPTRDAAVSAARALALRVLADRVEHGEDVPAIVADLLVVRV